MAPPIKAITSPNPPHPLLPWRRLRRAGDALTGSRWFPVERPIYVSFVSKAILWERGLCRHTAHDRPHQPSLCPRFLSHMKARPEDLGPPCALSSKSRPWPPSQGKSLIAHTLAAPKTQALDDGRRHCVQNERVMAGRRSAVVVPCLPLPPTPPSSTTNPTPPHRSTPRPDCLGRQGEPNSMPASPCSVPHPAPEPRAEVQDREPRPAAVPTAESRWMRRHRSPGPRRSPSPASLSDLSRPASSLFSRSTDLASGRSSVLSADIGDTDPEGSVCFSPRPVMHPPSVSRCPSISNSRRSSLNATTTPPLYEPMFGQTKPLSPLPTSAVISASDKPLNECESTKTTENLHRDPSVHPGLNPSLDSHHGLAALAFPSTTRSSCSSPQRTSPHSGSEPELTPSASVTPLESQRWPVLPPISPVRGRCGSAASHYSELSCHQSLVFAELEAIAPHSPSCPSLDEPADSSGYLSPDTELSPGLAALTVGCDSGNLGSLSRVQLLLLDRVELETLQSPCGLEEETPPMLDWSDLGMQCNLGSSGVLRPLTAGGVSERCDSAGKVRGNKSDQSEGGSGSPSSWIIDLSPSYNMFSSTYSPCKFNHGSSTDERGPTEEESNYLGWREVGSSAGGWRPKSVDHIAEERDRRMEERKTKVLSMLSKLQDSTPHRPNSNKGCSNFEEFDFLAKYCIFSQEKLTEYKRAFEAEDSDDDGYISCIQVLLALKNIIPPELLSDEEEIYVYRILEMVDFRVTDGLVDLRLFAVIASLAQKIATMDEFMRSLISNMDFRSLEVRLFKAKLFLFLLEEQRGDPGAERGFISTEQLLLELKAGGIHPEQEAAIRLELQHIPPLDLLDFLAYLPLFMIIHKSVISNPLNDSSSF